MKFAIIGYGKMGREIERIAIERGNSVPLIIDVDNSGDLNPEKLEGVDVAIEFTTPDTAYDNIRRCIEMGTPVVSGTTGWLEHMEEVEALCKEHNGGLFYASNYSLGVNLMFRLNKVLAKMINKVGGYDVELDEVHHIHKKDAPSGTAITIAEGIIENLDGRDEWVSESDSPAENQINIKSYREGEVVGIHGVRYTSHEDVLEVRHTVKNRAALALGAVIAAEFLAGKQGIYSMDDLLN
ncbi:MAG: 4-hydroxy-tetrahydrodipicolinate reductase [Rikenellaceae bacterium]